MYSETEFKFRLNRKKKSYYPSTLQLLISMFGFTSSTVLTVHNRFCSSSMQIFITGLLFASLGWIAILLLSWVAFCRNKIFHQIFTFFDFFFVSVFVVLWFWLVGIAIKRDVFGCQKMQNVFGILFLFIGFVQILLLVLTWILVRNPSVNFDSKAYQPFEECTESLSERK